MSGNWEDDATESAIGAFDDKSIELDIDFSTLPPPTSASEMSPETALRELWPDPKTQALGLDVIVFDPMQFGVADDMRTLGYPLREVASGVDVMTGIADHPTAAVICGPAEDAEQRRLLTAAIRLRFPQVPVIYVSTHAGNPAAVRGALAEGAHIVLPLPLPLGSEVATALAPYIRPRPVPAPITLGAPDPLDQKTIAVKHDELAGLLVPSAPPPFVPTEPPRVATLKDAYESAADSFDSEIATDLVMPAVRNVRLAPVMPPPPTGPGVDPERELRKGEIGELLRAISPFLWGLEDAGRWTDQKAALGDAAAAGHARTLKLLANILRQLQARVDEKGL